MVLGGNGVVNPFAEEIALGERFIVVAVVAEEMLGDSVGHDFVHVDADAGWGLGGIHAASMVSPWRCGMGSVRTVGHRSPIGRNFAHHSVIDIRRMSYYG